MTLLLLAARIYCSFFFWGMTLQQQQPKFGPLEENEIYGVMVHAYVPPHVVVRSRAVHAYLWI